MTDASAPLSFYLPRLISTTTQQNHYKLSLLRIRNSEFHRLTLIVVVFYFQQEANETSTCSSTSLSTIIIPLIHLFHSGDCVLVSLLVQYRSRWRHSKIWKIR